jgi:hypothetical protein
MKKLYSSFSAFVLSSVFSAAGFSQSQGPYSPGMVVNNPPQSCMACPGAIWNNETNVMVSDNMFAVAQLQPFGNCFQSTCYYTRHLQATNFNFTIPSNAAIMGIVAEVQRMASVNNVVFDSTLQVMKNGVPVGNNGASIGSWSTTNGYVMYGTPTWLWSTTWTPADINSAGFGVDLSVLNVNPNVMPMASIDHIRITVYYSVSTGISAASSSQHYLSASYHTSSQQVHVSYSLGASGQTGTLKMLNVLGQTIFSQSLHASQGKEIIDAENISPGMYFIRIESPGREHTKKVLVDR